MIEDEEVKIAENTEEAFWERKRKDVEQDVVNIRNNLKYAEAILHTLEQKVREASEEEDSP